MAEPTRIPVYLTIEAATIFDVMHAVNELKAYLENPLRARPVRLVDIIADVPKGELVRP